MTDLPLCGDDTCENPGCRQSAIDAWHERMEFNARRLVRGLLGQPVYVDNPSVNPGGG